MLNFWCFLNSWMLAKPIFGARDCARHFYLQRPRRIFFDTDDDRLKFMQAQDVWVSINLHLSFWFRLLRCQLSTGPAAVQLDPAAVHPSYTAVDWCGFEAVINCSAFNPALVIRWRVGWTGLSLSRRANHREVQMPPVFQTALHSPDAANIRALPAPRRM